jgi:REP element-mobilizing transposase RayT
MRKIRLPAAVYRGGDCFSVTVSVEGRVPMFRVSDHAQVVLSALRETAAKYRAAVFAYCLMPDHLHLVVSVPAPQNLVDFVRHFKQLSSFRLKRLAGKPIAVWQKRFYDRGLRSEEAFASEVAYVRNNPLAAGIASCVRDYPYAGSLVWDDEELGLKTAAYAEGTMRSRGLKTPTYSEEIPVPKRL